jgi:hypothetical protein
MSAISSLSSSIQHQRSWQFTSTPLQPPHYPLTNSFALCHHRAIAMEEGAAAFCCTPATQTTQHWPLLHMKNPSLPPNQGLTKRVRNNHCARIHWSITFLFEKYGDIYQQWTIIIPCEIALTLHCNTAKKTSEISPTQVWTPFSFLLFFQKLC